MKPTDLELMLYADGELDAERARRVRVARLHHGEVGARLEGIERIGAFVRVWAKTQDVDAPEVRRRAQRALARRRAFGVVAAALVVLAAAAEPVSSTTTPRLAVSPIPAVAIESVDFGERAGAVFVVETDSSATPVVWLEDDVRAGG
jgi:hypothetical protein